MRPYKAGLTAKLRYHFDNYMAWSAAGRFLLVFALGIGALVMGAVLLKLLAPSSDPAANAFEALWWSWGRVADPGSGAGDQGTGVRVAEIVTTLSGVLLFALLIGFVSDSVQEKIGDLRKGKSHVVEHDHSLILGFNARALHIITELAEANESRGDSCVVILSEQDKEHVIDELIGAFGKPKIRTTRIVVRAGSAFVPNDLLNVSAHLARSIVVLADDGESQGDVRVVKSVLALTRGLGTALRGHIVAELSDVDHRDVLTSLGSMQLEIVVAREFLARLLVQTARQTGLAQVYAMLLSFAGDEFYLVDVPAAFVGKTFDEAYLSVPQGIIVGTLSKARKEGQERRVHLNPAGNSILQAGDRFVILLEDDSIALAPRALRTTGALPKFSHHPIVLKQEHILILGFHNELGNMLLELDRYVADGSKVTIISSLDGGDIDRRLARFVNQLSHLHVETVEGDPTKKRDIELACATGFDSAIVLTDISEERSTDDTDARTLMSVLLVRSLAEGNPRIISEIRNPKTKELATVADVTDFVVSDELVSGLLAQVSENRELFELWEDLCSADGSEIYLKPASKYLAPNETVTFADLMARARTRNEVAIGYKLSKLERQADKAYGITLNPHDKESPLPVGVEDRVIVIAKDEH